MITDRLDNAATYRGLGKRMSAALRFLKRTDFSRVAPGRHEIDGANIYVLVQNYETKPREQGRWEAHRRYIDVHYMAEGAERIGFANVQDLKAAGEYCRKDDYVLFEGEGNSLVLREGCFAIFYPQDAHMPCLAVGGPEPVLKIVVKVRK